MISDELIFTDGKLFKLIFSTNIMIEMVRDQPCLWNKRVPEYRDNSARLRAWKEVFKHLEPGYDEMKPTLKIKIGQHVRKKWFNIRDAYLTSLKARQLANNRNRYSQSKRIPFLDPFLSEDKVHDAIYLEEEDYSEQETGETEIVESSYLYDNDLETPNKRAKLDKMDDTAYLEEEDYSEEETGETEINEPTLLYLDNLKTPSKRAKFDYNIKTELDSEESFELSKIVTKEDDSEETFFTSIIPVVKTLSVDAKLEFQIHILNVLKDIKKRDNRGEFS